MVKLYKQIRFHYKGRRLLNLLTKNNLDNKINPKNTQALQEKTRKTTTPIEESSLNSHHSGGSREDNRGRESNHSRTSENAM